jgi:hypothetical protein
MLLLAACTVSPPPKDPTDTAGPDDTDTTDTDTTDTDTTDTDTTDTDTDTTIPGWNGAGSYRILVTVPGYDPGSDEVDEGPAEVEINFAAALQVLGVEGHADLRSLQVIREADGAPLAPSVVPVDARSAYDVPYRIADRNLWGEGFAYNFAVTDEEVTLTFTHRQQGADDTDYAVYFDVQPDASAALSPRPALGDMDLRHLATGTLATMIHSRPYIVDLDTDGLLDLVMGDSLGRVSVYLNEGDATEPVWETAQLLSLTNGAPIQKNYLGIPEVVDWNDDGRLDLLVGSEYGAIVTFYAGTDTFGVYDDEGTLSADGAELQLPYEPVPEAPFYTRDYTAAPETVDWDNDGDLDLLLGGYVTGEIFLYTRDGDDLHFEGPIEADGAVIDTSWGASPVLVDLDADGDLDLLSGTFAWEITPEQAATWPPFFAWRNTAGPGVEPVFSAWSLTLSGGDTLAAGSLAGLRDGDIDGDGDIDLLVAAEGYAWIFRNIGTPDAPVFDQEDPLPEPMTTLPTGADAQAVDVDADGDLDLLSGGTIDVMWKENLGGADPVDWTSHSGFTADGSLIWHPFEGGDDTSFPVLEDWEDDGDLDLVVGTAEGYVDFYRNEGVLPAEGFAAGTRLMLLDGTPVLVGEYIDPDESFEGHSGNRAQPTSADIDGDGDRDLVVGDALGGVTLFRNVGDDTAPRFAAGEAVLTIPGERTAPSLVDWDDDGDPDLLLGRSAEVWIYTNTGDFVLDAGVQLSDPTIYYPHPYAADVNGDGDLDLSISSSYGYLYLAERTWIERGSAPATATTVESVDGGSAPYAVATESAWAYEADVLPSFADPAWTPYPLEGTVAGGILTLEPESSILIGTLFDAGGADAWPGTTGTEVELRLRIDVLVGGQTDVVNLAVSDGSNNWHLRWGIDEISFYGYSERHSVETTDWHTWRVAMGTDTLTVCRDDEPTTTWTSPPSLTYTRRALWIGDDGAGTGGTSEIEWVRWTTAGDGDACTGW